MTWPDQDRNKVSACFSPGYQSYLDISNLLNHKENWHLQPIKPVVSKGQMLHIGMCFFCSRTNTALRVFMQILFLALI